MYKKKRDSRITLVVIVLLAIVLSVMALVENAVSLDAETIRIGGIYGTAIAKEDIRTISLTDTLPAIQRRVHGASYFSIHKGIYRMQDIERARLLIHSSSGPYLRIEAVDEVVFINYRDDQKTENAYETVSSLVD